MATTLGKTTLGRKNPFNIGLILGGLALATLLGGLGIWEATQSSSSNPQAQPEAATVSRPDFSRVEPVQTYVYIVDSEAQKNTILQAEFEAQMGAPGTFTHNTRVLDVSTPEGQEAYRIMNGELNQVAMEAPDYVSNVHVVDLTAPASTSVQRPASNEIDRPGVPTYFYIVDSQEQANKVLQADSMAAQEAMMVGETPNAHHTVFVDVSTLEGAQLLNTINGELHEFWADPSVDKSLIQVIDARD
jgi:hypothetical protein